MKKLNRIEIICKSAEDRTLLLTILLEMGYKWHRSECEEYSVDEIDAGYRWTTYPHLLVETTQKGISGRISGCPADYPLFTWDGNNIKDIFNALIKSEQLPIEVELDSGNYTAIVSSYNISVGCQAISFETFDKIAEAVDKMRNA